MPQKKKKNPPKKPTNQQIKIAIGPMASIIVDA